MDPRCQGLLGSHKYTALSVYIVKASWAHISRPLSHVRLVKTCLGNRFICSVKDYTTLVSFLLSNLHSTVNLEWLSTTVATTLLCEAMIKSPSQCPGTARSSISGGRSRIEMASIIWPLVDNWCDFACRNIRFVRRGFLSFSRNKPSVCINSDLYIVSFQRHICFPSTAFFLSHTDIFSGD